MNDNDFEYERPPSTRLDILLAWLLVAFLFFGAFIVAPMMGWPI